MLTDLAALTRRLSSASVPAADVAAQPTDPAAAADPAAPPDLDQFRRHVWLRPGNLVDVCEELGAQLFSVVDGEVTFTARSADGVRRWRGRLGARGVVAL